MLCIITITVVPKGAGTEGTAGTAEVALIVPFKANGSLVDFEVSV